MLDSEKENIDVIKKNKKVKIKLKIQFILLFIQSFSQEKESTNNLNKESKNYNIFNNHYIFLTDKSTYKDYYFFERNR